MVVRGWRRRLNPSTTTWLLLAGAAALVVGGVTYVAFRRDSSRVPPVEPPMGNHVGAPGFVWPRPDLFPEPSSFGDALEQLGYEVGDWPSVSWSVSDPTMVQAVESFQRDYNLVRKTIDQPPTPQLEASGLLDADTVNAIAYVVALQDANIDWPIVVYQTTHAGIT